MKVRKSVVSLISILVLLLSTVYIVQFAILTPALSSVYVYPDQFPGLTLQQAIYSGTVGNGDTIYVKQGTYYGHLNVNKSITLEGFDRYTTFLDGNGTGIVVAVNASRVTIAEFTIRNGDYGVKFWLGTNNSHVGGNIVSDNTYGVLLERSRNNTMADNDIKYNTYNFGVLGNASSHFIQNIDTTNKVGGKKIYYWKNHEHDGQQIPSDAGYVAIVNSTDVTVRGLTLRNNYQGVLIVNSANIKVRDLLVLPPILYGVHLRNVTNSILGNTRFSHSGIGIDLKSSDNNTISGNEMLYNEACGIELQFSNNNTIIRNRIVNIGPEWSVGIALGDAEDNAIYQNNLINNLNQVFAVNSVNNRWNNGLEGNYWSDYTGLDNGSGGRVAGDGIGDTDLPHLGLDYYPLMEPWEPVKVFDVSWVNSTGESNLAYFVDKPFQVRTLSNSTRGRASSAFSRFGEAEAQFSFYLSSGTAESCNVTVIRDFLDGPFRLTVNSVDMSYSVAVNSTHVSLYFTYEPGFYDVVITGYRSGSIHGDVNRDGLVDIFDIILVAGQFGGQFPAP